MHKNALLREKVDSEKAFVIVGWYSMNHRVAPASAPNIRLLIVEQQDQ